MRVNSIVAFAGHMIDQPNRPAPRFPPYAEPMVRAKIREALVRLSPAAAVSSAACGGDIIFAEEALSLGIPLHIILPFENCEDFIHLSVANAGSGWVDRFNTICRHVFPLLYFVKAGGYEGDYDFEANQRAILFFALGVAAARNTQATGLVLCDEMQLGNQVGGTRSFLELCHELHTPYKIVDLDAIRSESMNPTELFLRRSLVLAGGI